MKALKSKLVIFLAIPLVFLLVVEAFPIKKEFYGICEKVLDGDTIIVAGKKIRLANIDAPETKQKSYDGLPIGTWSTDFLKNLILGKKVRVVFYKRGFYKRILGTVFYGLQEVNLKLVEEGMALAYRDDSPVRFTSMEFESRLLRKGIFASFGFDRPSYFRRQKRKRRRGTKHF